MILVTVGGQLPFDTLVEQVDQRAGTRGDLQFFAQIGKSDVVPSHMEFANVMQNSEFNRQLEECDAIVAHAGMGTVLTAFEHRKPLLIFPRRAEKGEHRNDHQVATARYFADRGLVRVAYDEEEFERELSALSEVRPVEGISRFASDELIVQIRGFVFPQEDQVHAEYENPTK